MLKNVKKEMTPTELNNSSTFKIISFIKKDWRVIAFIEKPSERIQLAAVNKNPVSIRYISHPTPLVSKIAIKQYPAIIRYLKNPSEKLKHLAVSSDETGNVIKYISKPSKKLIFKAIKKNAYAIKYIDPKYISEDIIIATAQKCPPAITSLIPVCSKETLNKLLGIDGSLICFIKNPTEHQQLTAIRSYPLAFKYMTTLSTQVEKEVLKLSKKDSRYLQAIPFLNYTNKELTDELLWDKDFPLIPESNSFEYIKNITQIN